VETLAQISPKQRALLRQENPASFGGQGPNANPQLLKAEAARKRGGRWRLANAFW
jgi:hypothetical protein